MARKPTAKKPAPKKSPAKKPAAKKKPSPKKADRKHETELVNAIGYGLLDDMEYDHDEWAAIALVVELHEGRTSFSGYWYDEKGNANPSIPEDYDLAGGTKALAAAMEKTDGKRWKAILIHLTRPGPELTIDFEYDNVDRWHIGPETYKTMPKKLRPAHPNW